MTAKLTTEQILARFYLATNGDEWARQDNWLTDRPLYEWHGIVTDEEGEVIQIVLPNNNLSGSIPAITGDLEGLMNLNLANNRLTGAIPAELAKLQNLRGLNLSHNLLTGVVPEELRELRLHAASISDNMLSDHPGFQMYVGNDSSAKCIQVKSIRKGALDTEQSDIFHLTVLRQVVSRAERDALKLAHQSTHQCVEELDQAWQELKDELYPGLEQWESHITAVFCGWCRAIMEDPSDTSCAQCEMGFDMKPKDNWVFPRREKTARKEERHSCQISLVPGGTGIRGSLPRLSGTELDGFHRRGGIRGDPQAGDGTGRTETIAPTYNRGHPRINPSGRTGRGPEPGPAPAPGIRTAGVSGRPAGGEMKGVRIENIQIRDIRITKDQDGREMYSIEYNKVPRATRAREAVSAPCRTTRKIWNRITTKALVAFIIGIMTGLILAM